MLTCQEDEQHSPVSVLQVGEDEFSPFDQSLANIESKFLLFPSIVSSNSLPDASYIYTNQYHQ